MPSVEFVCVHCGFPCGETGHVRLETPDAPICPNTAPLYAARSALRRTRNRRPRAMGYCCPPHTCQVGSLGQALDHSAEGGEWRSQRATRWQLEKLRQLRQPYDASMTKGQAHDALSELLAAPERKRDKASRGILLRDEKK